MAGPQTLDQIIEKEQERKAYREEYNKRPEVKDRRTLYNQKRNAEMKVAKEYQDGKIDKEEAERQLGVLAETYTEGIASLKS